MQKENRKYIDFFNPDVTVFCDVHQDFLSQIDKFDAGELNKNFNSFIKNDVQDEAEKGDGVTYFVWNVYKDVNDEEIHRELMAYYTLAVTSILYTERWRKDETEIEQGGEEFDTFLCGIPSLEIKMFAVDEKYQNLFYSDGESDMPIAAWILHGIINKAYQMSQTEIGLKAVFLHSVPEAERFYQQNSFHALPETMEALYSMESEFTPYYLSFQVIDIHYDD